MSCGGEVGGLCVQDIGGGVRERPTQEELCPRGESSVRERGGEEGERTEFSFKNEWETEKYIDVRNDGNIRTILIEDG